MKVNEITNEEIAPTVTVQPVNGQVPLPTPGQQIDPTKPVTITQADPNAPIAPVSEDLASDADAILTKIANEENFDMLDKVHMGVGSRLKPYAPGMVQAANIVDYLYLEGAQELNADPEQDFTKIYKYVMGCLVAEYADDEAGEEDRHNAHGELDPNGAHDAGGHFDLEKAIDEGKGKRRFRLKPIGGDKTDDFIKDVEVKVKESAELTAMLRIAGLR